MSKVEALKNLSSGRKLLGVDYYNYQTEEWRTMADGMNSSAHLKITVTSQRIVLAS